MSITHYEFDNANLLGDKEPVIPPNTHTQINKLSANEANNFRDKLNEVIDNVNILDPSSDNFVLKDPSPETSQTIQETVIIRKAGGIGGQKALSIVDADTDTETAYIDPNGDIRTISEIIGASIISEGKVFALTPNESGLPQDDELIRRDFLKSYVSSQVNPEIYTIQNATVGNVRNDSPSIITLSNGNLLCAFSHFGEADSDISTAYIAGKISTDKGKTWGSVFPLQTNISGAINTLGPSLYLNEEGNIVMVYLVSLEPNPTYKLYKTVFDQDFNVVSAAADLGISGDVASGTDRFYKDPSNGKLLLPIYRLVSGTGVSFASIYTGSILVSEDDGETFTDLGLSIGATKLLNGYGGATETGVYYTPQGLIAYFRTLLGATYGVKLDEDYNPVGEEFELYSSANAQSSIKWIPSLNMVVAARTRLINNDPIGDNVRKYLDLLASPSGVNFSTIDQIDYAIDDVDWYVNMPIVFDIEDTVQVGYNNSKTGIKTASLFNKIYPKSFIKYAYKYSKYRGLSEDGKGTLFNGVQIQNSTDNTNNIVLLENPLGGTLNTTAGLGAFKITFPNNRNANITIKGRVFSESAGESFSFTISCNTADMGSSCSVKFEHSELARAINIRFVNGTNPKIFIGDLDSIWNNPSLVIDKVIATNAAYLSELAEGWKVELETTGYGTVSSTINTGDNVKLVDVMLEHTPKLGGNLYKAMRDGDGFLAALTGGVPGVSFYDGATGGTLMFKMGLNGIESPKAKFTGLPVFADEAAASSLSSGDLYRTSTGEVRIKL